MKFTALAKATLAFSGILTTGTLTTEVHSGNQNKIKSQ